MPGGPILGLIFHSMSNNASKLVKVKFLRNVSHGNTNHSKGSNAEIPEAQAKEWAKGPKPAVEIQKV